MPEPDDQIPHGRHRIGVRPRRRGQHERPPVEYPGVCCREAVSLAARDGMTADEAHARGQRRLDRGDNGRLDAAGIGQHGPRSQGWRHGDGDLRDPVERCRDDHQVRGGCSGKRVAALIDGVSRARGGEDLGIDVDARHPHAGSPEPQCERTTDQPQADNRRGPRICAGDK